jgi:23S rRNA pseudouridine2605 synthase
MTGRQRPAGRGPAGRRGAATARDAYTVPATADAGPMRIQRALARAGVASRREADRLVTEGRVAVNGTRALTGQVVDPAHDVITVDGQRVRAARTTASWIVLHKPAGVMTTRADPQGRPTVFELVDEVPGLVYVGRLDFLTEGVLLLTTDGQAAHRLSHPSREVERTYVATVRGDAATAARIARGGVELEDGPVQPVAVRVAPLGDRRWAFEITLVDGRTREVRRLCEALDLRVERLVRTRYGPVELGALPPGQTRPLTARERLVIEGLSGAG